MEQSSRTQIRLRIPPITRARSTTTSTKNTLIHPIQLLPILFTLQILLPWRSGLVLPLQPRFNTLILIIKISHIHHQILDHKHMRKRGNHRSTSRFNLRKASEAVTAVDVHSAGAADSFAARSAEGEGRIHFVLDLDERIENHWTAFFEIDLVVFELWFRRLVGVPSID